MTGQFDYVHCLGGWYDKGGWLHWEPARMSYPKPFGQRRPVSRLDLEDVLQRISPRVWEEEDND